MKALTTNKTPKKRKKSKKNHYFTKVHEEAIIKYAATDCRDERTELYVEFIGPVFNEMVDKIVFTYKFTNLPNIDSLKDECKIWLVTILDKFDPSKGKSFGYFSVITKNWFIHKVKKNSKARKREVYYEDIITYGNDPKLVVHNTYHKDREHNEFWKFLWCEIDSWEKDQMKPNEQRVYEAVKIILNSSDEIEIFNKKAIYLYLREITGLTTKQVVDGLTRLRKKYFIWKSRWDSGEI